MNSDSLTALKCGDAAMNTSLSEQPPCASDQSSGLNIVTPLLTTSPNPSTTAMLKSPLQADKYPSHMERPSVIATATEHELSSMKPDLLHVEQANVTQTLPPVLLQPTSFLPSGSQSSLMNCTSSDVANGQPILEPHTTSTQQTPSVYNGIAQTGALGLEPTKQMMSQVKPQQITRTDQQSHPPTLQSSTSVYTKAPGTVGSVIPSQRSTTTPLTHSASTATVLTQPSITTTMLTHPASTTTMLTHPASTTTMLTQPASTTTMLTHPASTTTMLTHPASTTTMLTHPASTTTMLTHPASTTTMLTHPASTTTILTHPASTTTMLTNPASTTTMLTHPASTATMLTQPASTTTMLTHPASTTTILAHPVHSLLPKVTCPMVIPTPSVIRQQSSAKTTSTTVIGLQATPAPAGPSTGTPPPLQLNSISCSAVKPGTPIANLPLNAIYPSNPIVSTSKQPSEIPKFLTGKVDAKQFPPRHYDFGLLQIGSWKHDPKAAGMIASMVTSRFKVIFSQRKFIYEFQRNANNMQALIHGYKEMACIEIPFACVAGINISTHSPYEVVIEVDSPPLMYLGKQVLNSRSSGGYLPTRYDYSNTVDMTNGQLNTIPYHKLKLSSSSVKPKLIAFDPRFAALLATPIQVDPSKRLQPSCAASSVAATPTPKRKVAKENTPHTSDKATAKKRRSSSSSSTAHTDVHGCHCTSGCTSKRCPCGKSEGVCSQDCKCVECKNPLNILANAGVDVSIAKQDICLMQNIYKIKNIEQTVKEGSIECPCCSEEIPFKNIFGSEMVVCPSDCGGEYKFSWCSMELCEDECRPRYHCPICKSCGDYRDAHCTKCNKCFFAGTAGSFPCPCRERRSFIDTLGSFIMGLPGHYGDDDSDDDEYGW